MQQLTRDNRHALAHAQHTVDFCTVGMAKVTELRSKSEDPYPGLPVRLGRLDTPTSIRCAFKRLGDAVLTGKLDPKRANSAMYAVAGAAKALDMARAYEPPLPANGLPPPEFNISFADGGPGDYTIDVSDDVSEGARVYAALTKDQIPADTRIIWTRDEVPPEIADRLLKFFEGDDAKLKALFDAMAWKREQPKPAAPAAANAPPPATNIAPETIAAPKPSPAATAPVSKVESQPAAIAVPRPKPTPAPVKRLEPTAADVLPAVFETTEQAAERALNRAVARDRVSRLMADAQEMQQRVEADNERQRRELALREANLAKEQW